MEQLIHAIFNLNIWSVGKIFVMIGLAVYIVFAFVMVRQVKMMTEVVNGLMTSSLRIVSWLFFLFSIAVFIFILLYL